MSDIPLVKNLDEDQVKAADALIQKIFDHWDADLSVVLLRESQARDWTSLRAYTAMTNTLLDLTKIRQMLWDLDQ